MESLVKFNSLNTMIQVTKTIRKTVKKVAVVSMRITVKSLNMNKEKEGEAGRAVEVVEEIGETIRETLGSTIGEVIEGMIDGTKGGTIGRTIGRTIGGTIGRTRGGVIEEMIRGGMIQEVKVAKVAKAGRVIEKSIRAGGGGEQRK